MSKTSKKIVRVLGVIGAIAVLLLAGFPSDVLRQFFGEQNIVDELYWALKDTNVVDRGISGFLEPHIKRANAATFSIQTGYYIGNATDNRTITGLGFSPDLVILKDNTTAGSDGVLWRSSVMTAERTVKFEAEADLTTNAIQSLDSDGFTLGTSADVNSVNVMHHWVAFDGSDCTSNGTFCVGSYAGNGTATTVNTGFQPDLVVVKRSGASAAVWKTSSMGASNTNYFIATTQDTGGQMIQTLNATSFTVGNNATVNTSGNTYWFFAFKEVSGAMDVGTYTGNATDNTNISTSTDAGLTFLPNFAFVKNANAATAVAGVFSVSEHYGDRSFLATDAASAANNIQELRSTGGFQIGAASNVNGSGNTLYYAAFGGASAKAGGGGTFSMKNGSYSGTGTGFSVTGVGFAPDLVIIKHNDQATDQYAVFRTGQMYGNTTAYFPVTTANFINGITALGTDGFTIGTSTTVNTSGDTYYWTAFGNAWKPDKSGGASDFMIGSYIGDAFDNRNINRLPFQPDFVTVKRSGAVGNWRTSNMSSDTSLYFGATAQAANFIQALNSDGFQRGTGINAAGTTYMYFMFRTSGGNFSVNGYTGNGSATSTDTGFKPDLIWIKKSTGGTARGGALRTSAQGLGDAVQRFLNTATITGGVTSINSSGFSVGNAVETNENTFVYRYAAWRIPIPEFSQSAYRWFTASSSLDVGAPLAGQDATTTLSSAGQQFRLRMLLHASSSTLMPLAQRFKLQFAGKGAGTCASPSGTPSTYTDITGATAISYYNETPDNSSLLVANANDPTHGGHTIVNQTYEESNDFLSTSTVPMNGDGKWDFSLYDNGASAGTTYCIRAVKSDGNALSAYSVYPEITTATVASVSCSASATSTSFGTLSSESISTATNVTTTMTCGGASGCTLLVDDLGINDEGEWFPALVHSDGLHVIDSMTATLVAGTGGYGIQAATTTAGSGGTLSLSGIYNKSGNDVGRLSVTPVTLASSSAAITGREVVITHKAAIQYLTRAGSYTDTITYSCTGN